MQHHPPLLIAFKGHPGTGKSTVARALGRQLDIPLIDKDDIKDVLDGICADAGGLAYAAMFSVARRQLRQGLSVICDSPLSEPGGYVAAHELARATGAQLLLVECVCSSPAEWRRRVEARGAAGLPPHHIASWDDLEEHLRRRAEVSSYPIAAPHMVVDTLAPLGAIVQRIVGWLEERRSKGGAAL